MATNYVQRGDALNYTAGADIQSGEQTGLSHGLFGMPIISLSAYLSGNLTASAVMQETEEASMTDELHKITVPSIFLWGKYDFVVSPALAHSAYERVSSTSKSVVIFEKSGHSPMDNEASLFAQEVISFVEAHK